MSESQKKFTPQIEEKNEYIIKKIIWSKNFNILQICFQLCIKWMNLQDNINC